MADIRDEHGRPIQLTDEFGRPVQLTDEHGAPIHLTGVATTHGSTTIGSELYEKTTHDRKTDATMGSETHGGTHFAPGPVDYLKHGADAVAGAGAATVGVVAGAAKGAVTGAVAPVSHTQAHHGAGDDKKELERSTSSSSSSSEDDGQGGRRKKKKGLMKKIKEKLPGSHGEKEKEKEKQATAHSADTKVSGTAGGAPASTRVEYHEQEHEKRGFMDKIKDILPGHHSS